MFQITDSAAEILDSQYIIRECDRGGHPHLLVKVPDISKIPSADIGLEVKREDEGSVVVTLLLYDIPTEPVSYEMRFAPSEPPDLRFLQNFIDKSQFRLHPCARENGSWRVGPSQSFRIPANVLLRLKHFSLDWPKPDFATTVVESESKKTLDEEGGAPQPDLLVPDLQSQSVLEPIAQCRTGQPDPRDTVIKKLKEQNHILRDQLRTKDKRIIELEDELAEIKSKGRAYKLGDSKPWWRF